MRRLSPAILTMGMLGVVGLLVVAYVGKKLLARDAPEPVDNTVNVPMGLTDLKPGTKLTEAHLAMGPTLRSKLDRDVVLSTRSIVGRVVKNNIPATQPIRSTDLYPPGESAPLNLEPGMVAVTIPMNAPFNAKVDQYVNVHFVPEADPDAEDTGGRILTLFKGVKILAISTNSNSRNANNVTLELTQEQANIILLAKDKGTLTFVYAPEGKGKGGVAVNDKDRATLYEILGYTPEPETPAVAPFYTELYEGNGRRVNPFRDGVRVDASPGVQNSNQQLNPNATGRPNSSRPSGNSSGQNEAGSGGGSQRAPSGPTASRLRSQSEQ